MAKNKLTPKKLNKPPLICRIRHFTYSSPSARMRCNLGVRHHNKHCRDCNNYIANIMYNGFVEGFNSVTNPIFEQLERSEKSG